MQRLEIIGMSVNENQSIHIIIIDQLTSIKMGVLIMNSLFRFLVASTFTSAASYSNTLNDLNQCYEITENHYCDFKAKIVNAPFTDPSLIAILTWKHTVSCKYW